MTTEELKELGMEVTRRAESRMIYLDDVHYAIEVWPAYYDTWVKGDSYVMEFVVYRLLGERSFREKYVAGGPHPVEALDDAEWHIKGGLKWDGCVNYMYNQEQGMNLHGCGIDGRREELVLWEALYRLAADVIPNHWVGDM